MSLRARIQADLTRALRERDQARLAVLRTTLAAIVNAEAVDRAGAGGRTEVDRRALDATEIAAIVAGELAEREAARVEYERLGEETAARRLRREVEVLREYL